MGGLCVQVTFDGTPVDAGGVGAMMAAAPHRGRDGTRTWTGAGAGLGFQRTIVLPEDAVDGQPCEAGGLVVVADVRLDNRDELAPALLSRGYLADPADAPDVEFVLAAYRLWGGACPARLLGDFAFVIWDVRRRRLFAARDPMGMRALYYRHEPRRRVVAATELKQVLAAGGRREIFEPAIAATVAGPFLPPTWTAYAGIEQIAPGHAVTVDAEGYGVRRFWRPDPGARFTPATEQAAAAALRGVLAAAVRSRLRTSRPAGIFLSGGLDSGGVASMAGWLAQQGQIAPPDPIRAYAWAFAELPDADEREVSDRVVEHYPALSDCAVPADHGWPLAGYPEHTPDEDDPLSWVYQALIERTVRRCRDDGTGLLLSGDRGDELTGDWVYDELGMIARGHLTEAYEDIRSAVQSPELRPSVALRRRVIRPYVTARWPALQQRNLRRRGLDPWPPWVPRSLAVRTSLGDIIAAVTAPEPFDGAARTLRHQRIFLAESARIAVLQERTRARMGIGFADPFSDRRLAELILSLPQWLVQRRDRPKRLAREALRGVMPEAARTAARAIIPQALFERGLRDRAVPIVTDLLTGSMAAAGGWLDEDAARRVHRRYVETGDSDWDFWWPLTVEMWLRRWWA